MTIQTETTPRSVPEVLLMLRSPGSGWLATLLAAVGEASRDSDFSDSHRAILRQYLDNGMPAAVGEAALARTLAFQADLDRAAASATTEAPAIRHRVA